jgi:hypothetical protein
VVSSDEKEGGAREAGADEVARSDGPWKDEARDWSGGGVDVVIDPIDSDRFTDSLRSLREGGRAVVVGFTGGSVPEMKVNRLLLNNIEVIGAGWGAYRQRGVDDLALAIVADAGREEADLARPTAVTCRGSVHRLGVYQLRRFDGAPVAAVHWRWYGDERRKEMVLPDGQVAAARERPG